MRYPTALDAARRSARSSNLLRKCVRLYGADHERATGLGRNICEDPPLLTHAPADRRGDPAGGVRLSVAGGRGDRAAEGANGRVRRHDAGGQRAAVLPFAPGRGGVLPRFGVGKISAGTRQNFHPELARALKAVNVAAQGKARAQVRAVSETGGSHRPCVRRQRNKLKPLPVCAFPFDQSLVSKRSVLRRIPSTWLRSFYACGRRSEP
jgi:hypothetical protein